MSIEYRMLTVLFLATLIFGLGLGAVVVGAGAGTLWLLWTPLITIAVVAIVGFMLFLGSMLATSLSLLLFMLSYFIPISENQRKLNLPRWLELTFSWYEDGLIWLEKVCSPKEA